MKTLAKNVQVGQYLSNGGIWRRVQAVEACAEWEGLRIEVTADGRRGLFFADQEVEVVDRQEDVSHV